MTFIPTLPPCSSNNQITNDTGFVDDKEIEEVVKAAAGGNESAWQQLLAELHPQLSRIVAQPRFLGKLGGIEDDRLNIVLAVFERLKANQFARLGLYLEAHKTNPQLRFMSWLRVVAKRVGIDYLRAHPEYLRRHDANASRPGEWVDPKTLPPASALVGDRQHVTTKGTARELLRYAASELPTTQRRAIEMWLQSESFDDIAKQLELKTSAEADKLVRAGLERLRRKFRDSTRDGAK